MSEDKKMRESRDSRNPNIDIPSEFSIARSGVKKAFFRRVKTCPFSGPKAWSIDYKNVRVLRRYVSEKGKMIPSRITAVSVSKQRKLAQAIKRARYLALMPYTAQ